ncbi:MAG: SCP2 sterol-binding domain-containing protein [Clostridiaceae bacterium]|nr:SCP2 sterol-binding domain-containing protein [Clostridiaceae bacterium]
MKVNIYYGGRGLIEDPSLFAISKITTVLDELNIKVKKYNLYEDKRGISVLPKTLKEADAVILAASVEWMGIGGLLWQFLDACWLYGDKEKIKSLYMMPLVMATTYGEKDAQFTLVRAWEMLGGIPCDGICSYVSDPVAFETSADYAYLIEKKTENFYRTFSKKLSSFPSSSIAVRDNVLRPKTISLTPQESEQLSIYVSDDSYVKQQKEDIQELTRMFKEMMGDVPAAAEQPYIDVFTQAFCPVPDLALSFSWEIREQNRKLIVEIDNEKLHCSYGGKEDVDVAIRSNQEVIEKIIRGESTVQAAFLSGDLTARGNFKLLQSLDLLFRFGAQQKQAEKGISSKQE